MFCAIQEVILKKPNTYGAYKEFKVESMSFSINGATQKAKYSYSPQYDSGTFDRPHREAYKVSIHQNRRENGKVIATQCVIGTVDYYELADDQWGIYDLVESGLARAAKTFGKTQDELYGLVDAKVSPLRKQIQKEFHETEEYKAVHERQRIQKAYQQVKAAFAKQYSIEEDEYDYCFDVFGHVMNQKYLDEIKQRADAYSSYRERSDDNYTGNGAQGGHSSYSVFEGSNYTESEKQDLKKFYRILATKVHPDMNPGRDTTTQMQLLNKIKESWGI
jgi:hypothetical protein